MTSVPKPRERKIEEWADLITQLLETEFNKPIPGPIVGQITYYASDIVPDGYLLCDGGSVLIESYPALGRILGDLWGVAAAGYFKLPSLGTAGVDPDGLLILVKT